jgi:hypothetical protein
LPTFHDTNHRLKGRQDGFPIGTELHRCTC